MASGEPAVERKGCEKNDEERKEEDLWALVGVLISRELVCLLVRRSLLSLGAGAEGRSHYIGGGSPLRLPPPSRASSSG
eukprot:scaffold19177_cov125-Isochrysis_galbana.AAC.2